jgi:hypothetical protein
MLVDPITPEFLMKKATFTQPALMLAIVVGFAFSAKAGQGTDTTTITEVSSTVLTWSFDGGMTTTVNTLTPDSWDFVAPDAMVSSLGNPQTTDVYWKEPDYATSGLVNHLHFFQFGTANGTSTEVTVTSDTAQTQGYPLIDNFGTVDFFTQNNIVISGGDYVTFNDNGDAVPETGSSCILLLISGAALVGFDRLRARLRA